MLNKKALAASLSAKETDADFKQTVLLLHGDGTNGAQNNTFTDSSTNAFTITRNGNTTQGTFSPFSLSDGTWSNYFDGTANGSLRADSTTDTNLSGDFTLQAWIFPTENGQSSNSEIISRGASGSTNGWRLGLKSGGTKVFYAVNYAGTGSSVWAESTTSLTLNTWSHIAATRSGNTVTIYINGVSDATNTSFTTAPTVSGTEYVYVGRGSYDTTNRQFTGYISNASIIKGTALTTFNTTSALSASATNQSLLTCTSNRFIDANTTATAKTLTVGSGASVQAFSPFAPTDAYSAATNGGSGYFDGSGDWLDIGSTSQFNFGTGDFTIEFWIYPTATQAAYAGVAVQATDSDPSWYIQYDVNGTKLRLTSYSDNILVSATTVPINTWTHIAIVRNGSGSNNCKMYFNGVQDVQGTWTTTLGQTSALKIGAGSAGVSSPKIQGYLSGFRIINGTAQYTAGFTPPTAPPTAVTNTKLLCNFTNAGIIDQTGKNNLETVGNAQIDTGTKKFGTGSMEFDGTGDYLLVPDGPNLDFGTGAFTVEAWVNFSSVSGTRCIASNYLNSTSGWSIELSGGVIKVALSGDSYDITGTTTISTGTWYHVAVSGTPTSPGIKLFIDGTQEGSTYTGSVSLDTTSPINIGRLGTLGGDELNGFIDDLRITKGVARYTANFTVPSKAFADQ